MASTKVSDFILQRLRDWDVDHVFGYAGDGINGLLVQPTNPEALAAAFQRALAAPSMVQAGIDRNRQFAEQVLNIRNNTQHFLELFRKLKAAAEPRGVRR